LLTGEGVEFRCRWQTTGEPAPLDLEVLSRVVVLFFFVLVPAISLVLVVATACVVIVTAPGPATPRWMSHCNLPFG
jgi:hypothetical protein